MNKPYVHGGVVQAVILWNTRDLGYLTVLSSAQLVRGAFAPGATVIDAGRLGRIEVRGSEIVLGAPLLMNRGNIDKYDF
jgi:rhamnose transport system permease protein